MTNEPVPDAPPQHVRLAVTLLLGLGSLLLVSGALVFFVRSNIADGVLAAAADTGSANQPSRAELVSSLAVVAAIFVATGVGSLTAGYFVRRRMSWARFVGIGLGVLLGVLSVQFLLASGGGLVGLLLPVGAIGVAVTIVATLLSSPTAAWFGTR